MSIFLVKKSGKIRVEIYDRNFNNGIPLKRVISDPKKLIPEFNAKAFELSTENLGK